MLAMAAGAAGALILAGLTVRRHQRQFDFRGKSVLIAGGSRGLGLVISRQLAAQGARLAICARSQEELDAAVADLQSRGADVQAYRCDLANRDEAKHMVQQVLADLGTIDVLINNASTITVGPIETMTLDDYHYSMETIFWSAAHTAYYVVPHMQQKKSGRIVNIGSIGGKVGVPHLSTYCAAKFALTGWSRSIQAELRKDGIYVTTISPGLMRTSSPRNATFKSQNKAEYAWFKISDSLPGLTLSAEQAAYEIIEAARRGEVESVLGLPAQIAILFDNLAPELSGEIAALAARALPAVGGIGTRSARGAESESSATRSPLTKLTDTAARENNELIAG
ncbi:MAG TPA: SDR family NAD(P)-dependent oxidoreductase [Bryobacteraceae bacterium]|nr:SDR family NAD(P)-dependent oxidoreductase [Bryobacteraceae bacterium]